MAKGRARLNDENDPLSSTDKVLAGFEQLSQSAGQPDDKLTSQQVNKPATQPDDKLTSQQVSKTTTQHDDKLTSQQVSKTTSQHDDKSAIRKATFQLSVAVLQQLDKFHLELQLELGKVSAPYKEVIVEEAITRLLEQAQENPEELIAVLRQRQEKRK
ncbi:MAG TPA: hypothetical protein V6D26_28325 [Stenomitos sp.]